MSKLNNKKSIKKNHKIAIIGVGYVGLPLVIEFSKIFNVVGFDLNKDRIRDLKNSIDKNLEFTAEQLNKIPNYYEYLNKTEEIPTTKIGL